MWEIEVTDSFHYQKMDLPVRAIEDSHIIFGQLLKDGCIERYAVYINESTRLARNRLN